MSAHTANGDREPTAAPPSPTDAAAAATTPDLSGIDFSKPEACMDLKREHDRCFDAWLARFVHGDVTTDECKPAWERYRACTTVPQ